MNCFLKRIKYPLLAFAMLIFCMDVYGQIGFEPGYFINENNHRVDCYIKNVDWLYNPTELEYRLSDTSQVHTASIEQVKEFGIHDFSKYVRADVNIDRSEDDLSKLSTTMNPIWQEEVLLLKVLIEGKASLFLYEESGLKRFFYSINDLEIKQLVHKSFIFEYERIRENNEFLRHGNYSIRQNNQFRQQIFTDLQCQNIALNDISKLRYAQKELMRLFADYNNCQNTSQIIFGEKIRRNFINLSIRPGLNYSSLEISNPLLPKQYIDFGSALRYRLGFEMEFILPFNRNKWALLLEPTYQYFKASQKKDHQNVVVDYQSIEMSLGLRHYFHLNAHSKVFANASLIVDLSKNSTIKYSGGMLMEIMAVENYALGMGYTLNDRFTVELRYHTNRQILEKNTSWESKYQTFSFILGYSFY